MEKILLFIPMYNCEKQIVRVLEQLQGEICSYISEVLIVDNQSTDQGEEAVIKLLGQRQFPMPVKLHRNRENYGLGGSHKVAFSYAVRHQFDYVIVLHGDDQGHIRNALPVLKKGIHRKYDCCLGSRFFRQSDIRGYSKFRIFGNLIFNVIFSISAHRRIYDLGSGLNIYATHMLQSDFYHTYPDNLTFNNYMILALDAYAQTYHFFPIRWTEEDQTSNVKMLKQAWQVLSMAVGYLIGGSKYLQKDAREKKIALYQSELIYDSADDYVNTKAVQSE